MKLTGKNPVIERLRNNPATINKIFLQEGFQEAAYIYKKAKERGIPVFVVPSSKLLKIARHANTQGILAEVEDFAYTPYEELLDRALEKGKSLLFLDGLNDPQNLGVIIRSLACLGKFGIVIPRHDSVDVTEAVLRVASGADNYVPVARVGNLAPAILAAKSNGFWIAGAVVKEGLSLTEAAFSFPMGLVIGSEQKGIRDVIRKHLDQEITIPMAFDTLSFNAAQAATILCYEIVRQRHARRAAKESQYAKEKK